MPDLESIIGRLVEHHVEFVVVGGFAAAAHGSTMLTVDVDVCIDLSPANLDRLHRAVVDLHPIHRMTPSRKPFEGAGADVKNIYLDTDWGQLDCLGAVTGIGGYEAVLSESELMELAAGPCRVLSLDALILAKEALATPKDREAVLHLRAIREKRQS